MTRRTAKRINLTVAFAVIPLIVAAMVLIVRQWGLLFPLEVLAYDKMIARLASNDPGASPVVIIAVTEKDIQSWQQYPVSDRVMRDLLLRLLQGKPSTIGIDIYRDMPVADRAEPTALVDDHTKLMDVILAEPGILVVERIPGGPGDKSVVLPPQKLEGNDPNQQVAASRLVPDIDGVTRRSQLFFVNYRTNVYAPNLGVLLALKHLSQQDIIPTDEIESDFSPTIIGHARVDLPRYPIGFYRGRIEQTGRSGDYEIEAALARGEVHRYMIDFRAPRSFQTYGVSEVFDPTFDIRQLTSKILLVGVTAESIKDHVHTPFGNETFGVATHGYIADQLVRWAKGGVRPPEFIGERRSIGWVVLWALLGALAGGIGKFRSVWRMVLYVVLQIALLFTISFVLLQNSTIVPFVPPLLALVTSTLVSLAYISAVDRKDQRIVEQLMDMHISRPIAEQLLDNRDAFFEHGKLQPQRTTATVLFSDLMDFTPIAERLDSTQLMNWLNDFFQEMTDAVEQCGGVVNKFNGDMVMALFGPPRVREKEDDITADAQAGVRCAVLMRRSLARMNQDWARKGMPTPRMRIGIFTGPLVAGSLGGKNRVEYTVIGDTVNTASRLESTDKEDMQHAVDGVRIIIGEATCRALDSTFTTVKAGEWKVKGKPDPLVVHAVLDHVESTEKGTKKT